MPRKLQFYSTRPVRRASPEARLQEAVCQWLRLAGIRGLIWFHVPNGMVSDAKSVAAMKRRGLLPGVADLCIILPDAKARFLELKAPGGKPSQEQHVFAADCAINGMPYDLVDNIDDAIRVLREWGAIRGKICGQWGHVPKLEVLAAEILKSPQSKGGHARAAALSADQRKEFARKAAQARWDKSRREEALLL